MNIALRVVCGSWFKDGENDVDNGLKADEMVAGVVHAAVREPVDFWVLGQFALILAGVDIVSWCLKNRRLDWSGEFCFLRGF